MKFTGYIFDIYNQDFLEPGATMGNNKVSAIFITMIDYEDRRRIVKQLKHKGNKYTFSVSRGMGVHPNALNLKICLPRNKYPKGMNRLLCCVSDQKLIYSKLKDLVNKKYIFECVEMIYKRVNDEKPHIYYVLQHMQEI